MFSPYVFYLRVSTDEQDITTQEKECVKAILSREGKPFEYDLFTDDDVSSRIKMNKRPELMKMLESLQRDQTVVVFKLDRLSRDVVEMVTIYRMIKDKGCKIFSLNDSNCDDEFMIGLMGVLAQKERSDISLRIKAKFRSKRGSNEQISRYPPYGYSFDEGHTSIVNNKERTIRNLNEVPDEQNVIRRAVDLSNEGSSLREIVRILTDEGYKNRAGNDFQPMTISRILASLDKTKCVDPLLVSVGG
jgi:DNA invertase Pin-like site-specific DNA recombinase